MDLNIIFDLKEGTISLHRDADGRGILVLTLKAPARLTEFADALPSAMMDVVYAGCDEPEDVPLVGFESTAHPVDLQVAVMKAICEVYGQIVLPRPLPGMTMVSRYFVTCHDISR